MPNLPEQFGRARVCIAESRRSIARSRRRIDDSADTVTRFQTKFVSPEARLSDEEFLVVAELGEAQAEQRQIDREIRQTLRDWRAT